MKRKFEYYVNCARKCYGIKVEIKKDSITVSGDTINTETFVGSTMKKQFIDWYISERNRREYELNRILGKRR